MSTCSSSRCGRREKKVSRMYISSEGFRSTHVGEEIPALSRMLYNVCTIARTRGTLEECTNVSHALRSGGKLRRQDLGKPAVFRIKNATTLFTSQ